MLNFIFIDLLTHRTKLIKASIVIAFFCGMLLSPHLWINSGRLFSMMSPIEGMPILAAPFDKILSDNVQPLAVHAVVSAVIKSA